MSDEVLSNDGTKCREWEGGDEEATVDDRTGLVWHQLRDHKGEGKLDGTGKSSQNGASNDCRYVVRSATDYGSNQTEELSTDEEVSSSQYITQTTDQEKSHLLCGSVRLLQRCKERKPTPATRVKAVEMRV